MVGEESNSKTLIRYPSHYVAVNFYRIKKNGKVDEEYIAKEIFFCEVIEDFIIAIL